MIEVAGYAAALLVGIGVGAFAALTIALSRFFDGF